MPINDANPFPTRGQAFRLPVYLYDTSGNPISSAWSSITGLTVTVSSNGTSSSNVSGLTQIAGTNMGWIDLSSTVMDSPLIQVAISGTGVRTQNVSIFTVDLSDTPGATLRLDRMIGWLFRRWRNRRRHANGQIQVLRDGNSLGVFSAGTVTTSGPSTEAMEMS